MFQHCGYCGFSGEMVFVHSHYQCPVCHNNIMPCCEGEFADNLEEERRNLLPSADDAADDFVGDDISEEDDAVWGDDDLSEDDSWDDPEFPGPKAGPDGQMRLF
jgi:hypothetical protein